MNIGGYKTWFRNFNSPTAHIARDFAVLFRGIVSHCGEQLEGEAIEQITDQETLDASIACPLCELAYDQRVRDMQTVLDYIERIGGVAE